MFKFADDTKLVAKVGTEEDREVLRGDDPSSLFGWSQDWQMLFNLEKCAVMPFGFNNVEERVELGGRVLVSHTNEIIIIIIMSLMPVSSPDEDIGGDLGIIVQSNLKLDMVQQGGK